MRLVFKILVRLLLVILILCTLLALIYPVPATDEDLIKASVDSPKENLLRKKIPKKYEKQIAEALSHYPELEGDSIEFVLTDYGAPLESTFIINSLIFPWKERVYRINIREGSDTFFDPVLVKNLPPKSQVAIIGHELAHTLYYKQLHAGQIASWGVKYLVIPSFRKEHERFADKMTVQKGLGEELLEYATYVRNTSEFKDSYDSGESAWIDQYYLTPAEIIELLKAQKSEVPE